MHRGRIVERGAHDTLWLHPQHDYTRSLIAAAPQARDPSPVEPETIA